MLIKTAQIRLVAFSRCLCQQTGLPRRTLRALLICRLRALEKFENQPGFLHFPAFSASK